MRKNIAKIALAVFIIGLIVLFQKTGLGEYFSLEYIKQNQQRFAEFYQTHSLQTLAGFFALYVVVTALSLPGAAVMTLAAGALFGLATGTILVSFASSLGATLAFISSRYLFRDYVEKKFTKRAELINKGIRKDGAFYLFTLRLIPIFPFFVINLAMGLTALKTSVFYLVSQLGMLPGTIVYVNAGLQLGQVESLKDILSFELLASFALLGLFPLAAKKIVGLVKAGRVYRDYKKPASFDYNLAVIGAGSAGLVSAYIGATVKAKTVLIEKDKMGGDCLNTGCVPSKALIKSAKVAHHMRNADKYGLESATPSFDFKKVMGRVHGIIKKVEPHDSVERYTELGVDCVQGAAKLVSPWEIEVNGNTIRAKNVVIATGASPFVPPIPGLDQIKVLTSENLWQLEELPKRLVVLGGGPIGCEMAQSFARLGSRVVQVETGERLLRMEDPEVSEMVRGRFETEGVDVRLKTKAKKVRIEGGKKVLIAEYGGKDIEIEFDQLLAAVGRRPNVQGFGARELGIRLRENGSIEANEYLQTNFPNIYVCGDVTGPYQLTHAAAHQAWYCAVNALFGRFKKFKVDYSVIPWATYTDPEVATVGLTEQAAKKNNIEYELSVYGIDDLDRAIADSEDFGVVRVLTEPGKDKILGATIVAGRAADLQLEFIAAMKHGFGLNKILGTIHIYPTMGEANKFLAGNWKKARAPEKLLQFVEKYHRWNLR